MRAELTRCRDDQFRELSERTNSSLKCEKSRLNILDRSLSVFEFWLADPAQNV